MASKFLMRYDENEFPVGQINEIFMYLFICSCMLISLYNVTL